jgi:hypothetical protein
MVNIPSDQEAGARGLREARRPPEQRSAVIATWTHWQDGVCLGAGAWVFI